MKTLVEFYQKRKKYIQQQLQQKKIPSEIVEIIEEEIKPLSNTYGEYIGQLTQSQEHIAKKGLQQTLSWIRLLEAVVIQDFSTDKKTQISSRSNSKNSLIAKAKKFFSQDLTRRNILIGATVAVMITFLIYGNLYSDLEKIGDKFSLEFVLFQRYIYRRIYRNNF